MQDVSGDIYRVVMDIAKAQDGKHIIYNITPRLLHKKIGQQVNNLAHPYNRRVSQTSAVVKRSDREIFNKDALESERRILELENQIADIEEELSGDIFGDLSSAEVKNNQLWGLRNELQKLERTEKKASVKTSRRDS